MKKFQITIGAFAFLFAGFVSANCPDSSTTQKTKECNVEEAASKVEVIQKQQVRDSKNDFANKQKAFEDLINGDMDS
jgi:hypothetical protein